MPGILKPIGDKLQEKGIFNTWMLQEQDLIQAFAKAYADRIICEAFRETIAGQFGSVDPSLTGGLASVFHLHLLNSVEKDLSTFLASDLLNSSQAEQVVETSRRLCAELAPNSLALIEAFGLTKESCRAMTSSRKFSTTPSQTSPWATAASRGHFRKMTQNNITMLVTYEGMHWCNSAFQT